MAMTRAEWARSLDLAAFGLLLAGLAWLGVRGAEGLGYHWQWYAAPGYFGSFAEGGFTPGPLLRGLGVTVQITALSLVLCMAVGLVTALLRLSSSWAGRALARGYLEAIRNTPLLIQIFFVYFVLAPLTGLSAFGSAVAALSLFEGAYASEIIRAGIVSIPRGQWEAAASLGLGAFSTYRAVILPQALRRVLPPLAGQAVSLVKDSALVSTIAVYDLTLRGQLIVADTFQTFEVWFTVAGVYLVLTLSLSLAAGRLERRLAVGI